MIPNIFCERQRGNMCRMHSINNYIGNNILNEELFYNYCDNYDKQIIGLNSRNMDGFSEGRSIVSYIMDKIFNKYLLLIPINSYKESREHLNLEFFNEYIKKCSCYFEFNRNHIWVNKKINNKYYKIDSLSGVNETNMSQINNNGYFIVIDQENCDELLKYIINLIDTNNINININSNSNNEIYFYNLYYLLDKMNLSLDYFTNTDSIYIEKIVLLKNIKKVLYDFLIFKRKNKKTNYETQNILTIINYYKKNIINNIK